MRQRKGIIFILLLMSLIFEFHMMEVAKAQGSEETEATVEIKQVQGEVSLLTPRRNPKYIGITYKEEKEGMAYEIVLFIDENTTFKNKKSLAEIGLGDAVDITYKEITTTIMTIEGEREQSQRVAKEIRFFKPANKTTRHKYGVFTDEEKREMREIREEEDINILDSGDKE